MMPDADGQPSVGPNARALGVRPDEIEQADGDALPRTGGMSVTLGSPTDLPLFRQPRGFSPHAVGRRGDCIFALESDACVPHGLLMRPDPKQPHRHAFRGAGGAYPVFKLRQRARLDAPEVAKGLAMRPYLEAYTLLERALLLLDEIDEKAADRIRDAMDPVWYSLTDDELALLRARAPVAPAPYIATRPSRAAAPVDLPHPPDELPTNRAIVTGAVTVRSLSTPQAAAVFTHHAP